MIVSIVLFDSWRHSIKFTIEFRAIDSFDARIRCTGDWMSRFIKNVLMNKFLTEYRVQGKGKELTNDLPD